MLNDEVFMHLAIKKAWEFQTLTLPNPAVGALVSKDSKIISLNAHQKASYAHAEVLALRDAYCFLTKTSKIKDWLDSKSLHEFLLKNHNGIFKECEIYVTLEPCNHFGKTPPCSGLLLELGLKRIIVGAKEKNLIATGGLKKLQSLNITYGVLNKECQELLHPFLTLNNNKKFTLFKLAHKISGNYTNGKISNSTCQVFTHNMRSVADNIVIGGGTLRADNPMLDARFSTSIYKNSKDAKKSIFILSKSLKDEDLKPYNLYQKARIIRNLDEIPNGFTIIEGGLKMLDLAKDRIDMFLGYMSFNMSNLAFKNEIKNIDINLKLIHQDILEDEDKNLIYWLANA